MADIKRMLGILFTVVVALPSITWASGQLPWVLVDTHALTLTVFSAENHALARFNNISIGRGGAADMHHRGDETTPTGVFRVAWIDRHSRYGTFYGLNYPSANIARRAYADGVISQAEFDAIIKALQHHRTPPQNTPLGGRLGIHGLGRGDLTIHQTINWTNGCVALDNRQLQQLSRWVRVGTRVVIR